MSRALDDLSPEMRPLAVELLARCVEAGLAVVIVDTLRTPEEHAANLRAGTSWTVHSKHLYGDAIDIAPFESWALHGPDKIRWQASDPVWLKLGVLGEAVGLRWGGRWTVQDLGHFELVRNP
jgi:peptidoglycan LD-endopeptidase CwlK